MEEWSEAVFSPERETAETEPPAAFVPEQLQAREKPRGGGGGDDERNVFLRPGP